MKPTAEDLIKHGVNKKKVFLHRFKPTSFPGSKWELTTEVK